jgi:hypothetical protein
MKTQIKNTNRFVLGYFIVIVLFLFFLSSCGSNSTKKQNKTTEYATLKLNEIASDSTEYDIIISDVGYESFLATQKPMNFYSQRYYENWNRYYVLDWNEKVRNSVYHSSKYQNVFDMLIDYDTSTDYGLEVNYKLYYYFMFVQKRYGVRFNVPRAIKY